MTVNEMKDFIFEMCYKLIGFSKESNFIQWNIRKKDSQLFAIELTKKIPDSRNVTEPYQSFIRKKVTKSVK